MTLSAATVMPLIKRWSVHPAVVFGCLLIGGILGTYFPEQSKSLSTISTIYVDLLKMIVLPFLVSAVIFSLQKLFRDGDSGRMMGRLIAVFLAGTVAAALIGLAITLFQPPGLGVDRDTRAALGGIVGNDADRANTMIPLLSPEAVVPKLTVESVILSLVPSNIFESLSQGDMLKALVFAMLFGIAAGQVPSRVSTSLNDALETIYRSCQTLARWINFPLPLVLICLAASQIALSGWSPILAMGSFVGNYLLIGAVLCLISVWIIAQRSGQSLAAVLQALREAIALAIATNNIAVCMPAMMEGLSERLAFMRTRVELLVPLTASLFRAGQVVYFVAATLFVAQVYENELSGAELLLLGLVAWVSSFATGGMTGVALITMTGGICAQLNLPFEAAFVLFVAVDPICTMMRTVMNVVTSCAAITAICPRPLKLT